MAKEPPKHRAPWDREDDRYLRELAGENTPTRVMGIKLRRTPDAVRGRARTLHVSLRPWNQRPYSRRPR